MYIWQESVKKENQHLKVYEHFTINPHKCITPAIAQCTLSRRNRITTSCSRSSCRRTAPCPRPHSRSTKSPTIRPPWRVSLRHLRLEEIIDKLNTMNRTPKQKYQFPQTSNQEFGWNSVPISPPKLAKQEHLPLEVHLPAQALQGNQLRQRLLHDEQEKPLF